MTTPFGHTPETTLADTESAWIHVRRTATSACTAAWTLCRTLLCATVVFAAGTLITVPACGQTADPILSDVTVTGIDSLLIEELAPSLLSKRGGILNDGLVDHDTGYLRDALRERGWWSASVTASVDSAEGGTRSLTFSVDAGRPALFGGVDAFFEAGGTPEPVEGASGIYGGRFTRETLEGIIGGLTDRYARDGYPGVRVTPSLTAHGDTVHVTLLTVPGARARIDSIAVGGLTATKDYVIRRELARLIGRTAVSSVPLEAVDILGRLGFVRLEGEPSITYDGGRGVLAVNLSEGAQGAFDGVLGYQPGGDGGSGRMVGRIDLGLANMFGTGRRASFRWENLGDSAEDLMAAYTEPWIFGRPWNVSASFTQEEREQRGYTRTVLSGSVGRDIGRLAAQAALRYEKVSADSLDSSNGVGLAGTASWTALDSRHNPSRGIRYAGSWSTTSKNYRFGGRRDTRIERLDLDFDHYIPSGRRRTAAVLVRYRRVDVPREHLSLSDRWWLGGATTIRGHGESMYPAVKALWTSAEYRFLTGEGSRVFLFADTGWLVDRTKQNGAWEKKTRNVTGYGFGLRLRSRAGELGFDYGLGKGDSPGDGKVHVSMRTEF